MELTFDPSKTPFNLDHTLNCGQVFRWHKYNGCWFGVVNGSVIKMEQKGNKLIFNAYPSQSPEFIKRYFRFHDNLPEILHQINKDNLIHNAIKRFYGLRIIDQDPWECLISYICSRRTKITKIMSIIYNLSKQFGEELSLNGYTNYSFPKPEVLANTKTNELLRSSLTFGERQASEINEIAKRVCAGEINFEHLRELSYTNARNELLSLPGVGKKVADCVLLFSLGKLEAFPIDVWVKRVMLQHYGSHFTFINPLMGKSLTSSQYDKIASFAREYFGKYAGYAQEYLFYYVRASNMNLI